MRHLQHRTESKGGARLAVVVEDVLGSSEKVSIQRRTSRIESFCREAANIIQLTTLRPVGAKNWSCLLWLDEPPPESLTKRVASSRASLSVTTCSSMSHHHV